MNEIKLSSKALLTLGEQISGDLQPRNIEGDIRRLGYHDLNSPPDFAISFLENYSGVEFTSISNHYGSRMEVCFGLSKAYESGGLKEMAEDAEILLEKKFYPVGSIDEIELEQPLCCDRLTLLLAEDGSIYSYYSNVIQKEGVDIYDFINRVVEDQPIKKETQEHTINYSDHDPNLQALKKKRRREKKSKMKTKN